jgi:hypothetical protein
MSHFVKSLIISVIVVGVFLASSVTAFSAASFESGDSVSVSKQSQNLYTAGSNVTIQGEVLKDLIAAGGNVTVNTKVYRSMFVAGGTVKINSEYLEGSARIAGGDVTISGNFNEDVIIAGGNVVLDNAKIQGDVYVATGNLTVKNSKIQGSLKGAYSELQGDDIKSQVVGEVSLKKSEKDDVNNKQQNQWQMINDQIPWQMSVLIATLILAFILWQRKKLHAPSIAFNGAFGIDILIGLGVFVLAGILFILLLLLVSFPLAFIMMGGVIISYLTSLLILPIYTGNLIKNSFAPNLGIRLSVVLAFVVLVVLGLLTNTAIGVLAGILLSVLAMAHFGFIFRKLYQIFNLSYPKRLEKMKE